MYGFNDLHAADYKVEVDKSTLPPNYVVSPSKYVGELTIDSNGSPTTVILTSNYTDDSTIDFCYKYFQLMRDIVNFRDKFGELIEEPQIKRESF